MSLLEEMKRDIKMHPLDRDVEIMAQAADRIAELELRLAVEKKRANAQAMLIKSQEKQLTEFGRQKDSWSEAVATLDSEREANALLTRQLAERGEAVGEVVFNANGFKEVRFDARKLPAGALLYTGPQVPEGWNLVPKEPTNEMRVEGWKAAVDGGVRNIDVADIHIVYEAMLAAAPQPEVNHD